MASPTFGNIPSAPSPNLFATHPAPAPNPVVADAPQAFSNVLEQGMRRQQRAPAPEPREAAQSAAHAPPPARTTSDAPARDTQAADGSVTGHIPASPSAGPEASGAGPGLERPGRLLPVPGGAAPEPSDARAPLAAFDPAAVYADAPVSGGAVAILTAQEALTAAAAQADALDADAVPATLLEADADTDPVAAQAPIIVAPPLAAQELAPLPSQELEPAQASTEPLLVATTKEPLAPNLPAIPASLAAIAPILAALGLTPATADGASDEGSPGTAPRSPLDSLLARLFGQPPAARPMTSMPGEAMNQAGAHLAASNPALSNSSRFNLTDPGMPWMRTSPGEAAGAAIGAAALPLRSTSAAALVAQTPLFAQNATGSAQPVVHAEPAANTLLTPGMAAAVRTDPALLPQLPVATPAGQRMWAEDVGTRMIWMVGRNESRAELVLTPPSLGKVGVSIQFSGDQATAHFVAATSAAREMLEQAMPRLREVLQQAGIQLGQANVSTAGEHQAREHAGAHRSALASGLSQASTEGDPTSPPSVASNWLRGATGVIDIFA